MKESKIMRNLHKIRENMHKMSRKEFSKSLAASREEYKKLKEA